VLANTLARNFFDTFCHRIYHFSIKNSYTFIFVHDIHVSPFSWSDFNYPSPPSVTNWRTSHSHT